MKKNVKNSEFFRLQLSSYSVIIRFATEAENYFHSCLYSVVFRDENKHLTKIEGFKSFGDAQAYIFENYAWMFIPYRQYIHEGRHLFVY